MYVLSVRKITELAGLAQSEVLVASFACAFLGPGKNLLGVLGLRHVNKGPGAKGDANGSA